MKGKRISSDRGVRKEFGGTGGRVESAVSV
jgi:hypothetical protein